VPDAAPSTAADADATVVRPGAPRSAEDAAKMARHDNVMQVPIILSAILPLIVAPQQGHPVSVVIGIVSWLVFKFDLGIVVLTAPWFLLPGAQAGGIVVVLRLARLVRVLVVSRGARKLFSQLGRVALVAIGVVVVGATVAYYAEHPTNPDYKTFGDSLWWGIVTLTTVGYGDIVPITNTGRWAGVFIMVTGIGVLGVLAGSLASFFRLQSKASGDDEAAAEEGLEQHVAVSDDAGPSDPQPAASTSTVTLDALMTELHLLRTQVATLTARLNGP
jgi:voltage-gated potassium channel